MNKTPRYSRSFSRALSAIFIFLLIGTAAFSQDKGQTLTPRQVTKIQHVDNAIITANGETIAYTLSHPANPMEENKPAENHLYVRNMDDDSGTAFVTAMDVSGIAFRPNHNAITFLGQREDDENTALYQISMNGGEPQKIFSHATSIASYSWAGDGNHIAFMASETIKKSDNPLPYQPDIYEENVPQRRGYVTNLAKENHPPHQLTVEGSVYTIKWSPDDKSLAVAAAPSPRIDDYYMKQQVMITDHHGEKKATVNHSGKLGQIAWSPDGKHLAMIAAADINDPIAGRLFVVPSSGGEPTQLSPDFKGMFEQVAWADKSTLKFITSKGVWSTFGSINADGTEMRTIIAPGETILHHFAQADNGSTVFLADQATHPQELYMMNAGDTKPRRITDSNPWLSDVKMGKQQVITWKADDGLELQGLLIYPVDYNKGEKHPMITVVHGGPEAHYDNGWLTDYSDPGQVGAGQGYFVFYPNYRGSTGRGVEFAKSSQADMAGAEFDDIVKGVDQLIAQGIADSARVGVTGGSYGGYATGWFSTRYTNRFAAGVMFVGISNNISKWGTSDIPEELYLVHARERIWNNYMDFLKRSPIYYAGQADTPLLIMAGKQDTRVDPGQSYELYRHIKTRTDTPVRLVLYPGEGHGNQNATAQYDYNLRMMRWFGEYLKGDDKMMRPDAEIDRELIEMEN